VVFQGAISNRNITPKNHNSKMALPESQLRQKLAKDQVRKEQGGLLNSYEII